MNRTLVATARKKLLRRGRALLRSAQASGTATSTLGGMNEPQLTELREIHAALERIERGIFGRCDTCQGAIEEASLEATPWERDCLVCRGEDQEAVSLQLSALSS